MHHLNLTILSEKHKNDIKISVLPVFFELFTKLENYLFDPHNSRTDWPVKLLISSFSFSDKRFQNMHILFLTKVFQIVHKTYSILVWVPFPLTVI